MKRKLLLLVAGTTSSLLVVVAALLVMSGSGQADSPCPPGMVPHSGATGIICIPALDPGTPGGPGEGGGGGNSDAGSAVCRDDSGAEIPCVTDEGIWFSDQNCYATVASPQPPAASPPWEGHKPSEGSLWMCTNTPLATPWYWFVPNGRVTPPDPAELARRALEQLELAVPTVHMAPDPPLMSYVGLETWLWMDPGQWQTLRLTVRAGATSVTVAAEPVVATWDLTEGSTTCASPGRPWVRGMGDGERTDCSYTFITVSDGQPDDAYPVSATLTYQVDWTCSGACSASSGTLGRVDGLPGTSAVQVGERQSVVVR